MPDEQDEEISKLLRLKRFEQPPPGYFDDFLQDFHRRQRAELLRQPLWRIAWDRAAAFFSEETAGHYAYGAATALVLLAATVTSVSILQPPKAEQSIAKGPERTPAKVEELKLDQRAQVARLPDLNDLTNRAAQSATVSLRP